MKGSGGVCALAKATRTALVATTGAVLLFGLIALRIREGRPPGWDLRGLALVSPHVRPVGWMFTAATDIVGEYRGLWFAALFVLCLLLARRFRAALGFSVVMAGTLATAVSLKPFFSRPSLIDGRHGYFPSTHSAGAMALALTVAAVAWKTRLRWAVIGLCAATVVFYGAALVYSRDHYPSDVVCGWCIAVAWTGAVALSRGLLLRLPGAPRARRGALTRPSGRIWRRSSQHRRRLAP